MFDGALRYDTQDTDALKNILSYCNAISENTQRIIQVKQLGHDATEVTKVTRELYESSSVERNESRENSSECCERKQEFVHSLLIQNESGIRSRSRCQTGSHDKSRPYLQVEALLKFDTSLQPQVFKQILPHLGFHAR